MIVTIDGPAGTGKSTVAKLVAEKKGFAFFDTGAMYRAVTYCLMKKGIALDDAAAIDALLSTFHFRIVSDKGEKRYFVDQEEITEVIRRSEVTQHVSAVSALAAVRKAMVELQRRFAKENDAVFEGRDLGTVVFPKADLKIFLTASPEIRAKRRFLEVTSKGLDPEVTEQEILADIMRRDVFDSTRPISPLQAASDAHLIDTSTMTLEQVVDAVLALFPKRTAS